MLENATPADAADSPPHHRAPGHGHAHTHHPGLSAAARAAEPQGSGVRVRFCPSPTGVPHVGLMRTALFNWAHARHVGGRFVFRIEDTDAARDSQESYLQLLEALRWLGLDWDEGVEVGGPHGPYRQSERLGIYADVAARLLEAGFAYESFATPEEIEARHVAAGRDPKLGYDGFERDLTQEQRTALRAQGREPVLRIRMPDDDITFTDIVRGPLTFRAGSVPDFVIVRANGRPLYTLTNPVDDALMGITHVLRGEDLLSSTPRQVVLFRALVAIGVARVEPVYGHLPYVMGEGNRKLSKRDPESNLFLHRERGFLPEGLLNYLALLGWGLSADRDVFTVDELVAAFDAHDVNPNPARFDLAKAEAINAEHIRMLDPQDLAARIVPFLHAEGLVAAPALGDLDAAEQSAVRAAAPLIQPRLTVLGEAPAKVRFLFVSDVDLVVEPEARSVLRPESPAVLDAALAALEPIPAEEFTTARVEEALRVAVVEGLGIKPRFAFGPVRTAVTGSRVSPPLFESMEILGRESVLARIRALRSSV